MAHLDWTAEELRRAQDGRLRRLIRLAVERSPWHRERLAGVEVSTLTVGDLSTLPVMTKSDLMDNFDDIVTDRRLSLDVCERHVDALRGDAYLLDEFHVIASGGSSGQRGVFVYGWDAWATCYASIARFPARDRTQHPELTSTSADNISSSTRFGKHHAAQTSPRYRGAVDTDALASRIEDALRDLGSTHRP